MIRPDHRRGSGYCYFLFYQSLGGASGKEPVNAGKMPWRRTQHPLQYSRLESPMDRGSWWATVHGVERVGHDWSDWAHTGRVICSPTTNFHQETVSRQHCCVHRWVSIRISSGIERQWPHHSLDTFWLHIPCSDTTCQADQSFLPKSSETDRRVPCLPSSHL